MNNYSEITKIYKALCDENRIAILKYLQTGDKCACKIGEKLDIAQSKLSYHMNILCESGMVERWYVGKWTHYKINANGSLNAIKVIAELTTTDSSDTEIC